MGWPWLKWWREGTGCARDHEPDKPDVRPSPPCTAIIYRTAIVEPVDVQGAVIYGVELALWTGIFALGALFNLRYWLKGELGEDGSHVPNAVDLDDPAATGGIEGADTSLDQNVDASSSIHSTSSRSVFRTVGLRQRALKVIRVRADHVP